jgi:hypothetical protein
MDAAACSPAEPALSRQGYSTDARRRLQGVLFAEPYPWVSLCKQDTSHVLFAFAKLRSYPTSCSLHNGRIGLIESLLLAVLSYRVVDALRSTDRVTTLVLRPRPE